MAAAPHRPAPGASAARASPPRRLLLAAFGDAGHAFPMIALGRALVARGHDVCLETWSHWRDHVEAGGMDFSAAPEYPVFSTAQTAGNPYAPVVPAAHITRRLVAEWRPDACVHDILTLAPALAAEAERVPVATLVPHIHPYAAPGFPPYALGARLPRTPVGAAFWRRVEPAVRRALEAGRTQLNQSRAELGLPPRSYLHTGLSRELTLVATLPQLEYPRRWVGWTRLIGPLLWEPPSVRVEAPPGTAPVVLVAPSTAQDPHHTLLRTALAGLGELPVRVIAVCREPAALDRAHVPANAVVVPWPPWEITASQAGIVSA